MIVVDASVAAKWVLRDEERTDAAAALLAAALDADELLIAPPLLPFEITNIIHQRVRRGQIDPSRGRDFIDGFLSLPIEIWSPSGLHERALALASDFALPAAYDAHYLALAEFAGCDLWTDDRRLLRGVGDQFPALRWIGDYRP